ncbi:14160_t:CDS:2, partial [Funneliformis geosporum]
SGDTPRLTKLINLTGHNLYKGCRYSNIRDIYKNHVYLPTMPPREKRNEYKQYDPKNLPIQAQLNEIGNEMHSIRKSLPTYLRSPPCNIVIHHNGYKAEEWAAWITMYFLPLLKGQILDRHYKGWVYFVKAVRLCQKLTLTSQELKAYTQPVRIEKDKEKFSASYDVRGRTLKNKIRTVTDKKWAVYWI